MPSLKGVESYDGRPMPSRETLIREQADRHRKRLAVMQLQHSQKLAYSKRLEELQMKRVRDEEQLSNTVAKLGTIQEEKKLIYTQQQQLLQQQQQQQQQQTNGNNNTSTSNVSLLDKLALLDGLLAEINKPKHNSSFDTATTTTDMPEVDRLEDLESILDEMERDLSYNRTSLSSRLKSSPSKQWSSESRQQQPVRSAVISKLDQIEALARSLHDTIREPEQLERLTDELLEAEQALRSEERSFENVDACQRAVSDLGCHLMKRKRAELDGRDPGRTKLQKLELSKIHWVMGKFKWRQVCRLEEELDNRVAPTRLAMLLARLSAEKEDLGLLSVTALLLNTELLEELDQEHSLDMSRSSWSQKEMAAIRPVLKPIFDVVTQGWLQAVRHAIEWSVKKDSELDSHLALAHLAAHRKTKQISALKANPDAHEELILAQQDLQCISVWARQWARDRHTGDELQFTCFAVLHEAEQIERLSRRLRGIANPEQQAVLQEMVQHCNNMCEEVLELKADQIRALLSQLHLLRAGKVSVDTAAEELSDVLAVAVRCQRKLLAEQTEEPSEAIRKRHGELATLVVMLKRAQLARLQSYGDSDSRRGEILRVQDQLGEMSIGLQEELEGRVLTRLQQAEEGTLNEAEQKELAQMRTEYQELNANCILWELRKTEQEVTRIDQGQLVGFEPLEVKVLDVEKEILKARVRELELMYVFWSTSEALICPDSTFEQQILKQRKRMARFDRLLVQRASIVERLCSQKGLDEQGRRLLAVHQAESEVESEAEYLRSNLTDTEHEISTLREQQQVLEPIDQSLQWEEEAMMAAESLGQSESEFTTFRRFDEKRVAEAASLARLHMLVTQEALAEEEERRLIDKRARVPDLLRDESVAVELQKVLAEAEVASAEEDALEQGCREEQEKAALYDLMNIYRRAERKENEKLDILKRGVEVWRVTRNGLTKAHRTRLWLEVTAVKANVLHWDSKRNTKTKMFDLNQTTELHLDSKHGLFGTKKWPFRGLPARHEGLCFSLVNPGGNSLDLCCSNHTDYERWTRFLQEALAALAWDPNKAELTSKTHEDNLQSAEETPTRPGDLPSPLLLHVASSDHLLFNNNENKKD